MKNWVGNKNSLYKTLGASSHTDKERELNDYYATEPKATEVLLEVENFENVLEPACGEGHISEVLLRHGIDVLSSDLIDRGYGQMTRDFFSIPEWHGDIITNPPYKYALEFAKHALRIMQPGRKLALFLKVQFLEGKKRKKFFLESPPKVIYVSSSRLLCSKNGMFAPVVNGKRKKVEGYVSSSAVAFAWFVWVKGYNGDTVVKWVN